MFDDAILARAAAVIEACRRRGVMVVIAESCTGGLACAALTAVAGSSDAFDRGIVTYSYAAKTELLGVPQATIRERGAVSEEVARAMAEGAVAGLADRVSVAVTGVAGPGSDSQEKPAGLVHFAAVSASGDVLHRMREYGDIGRAEVRLASVAEALDLLLEAVEAR